jgi:DHA1 family inner membrane transport protein
VRSRRDQNDGGSFRPEVRRVLPVLVLLRFFVNVAGRMLYTFLPSFARGTGLSVGAMGRVIAGGELMALIAPWSGRATDRIGSSKVMVNSGLVIAGGLLMAVFGMPGVIVGVLVFGLARTGFHVSMNSWIGDEVAYERRGRATGFIEMSWGAASLLGLPVVGLLIDNFGWRTPFIVCGLAIAPLSWITQRRSTNATHDSRASRKPSMTPAVYAALVVSAAMTAAAQTFVFSHGLWLEDTYNLDTAQVGFAVIAVGAIELIATFGSANFTDRLGKKTSMLSGTGLLSAALVILAFVPAPPLAIGIALLVVAFLGFEFAIVSSIPLIAELDTEARAQMVGLWVAVTTVARAVVTILATWLYTRYGFDAVMTAGAGFGALAIGLGLAAMKEPTPSQAV